MEIPQPACAVGGEVSNASILDSSMVVPPNIVHGITTWSTNSASGHVDTRIEGGVLKRYLHSHVHSRLVRDS